MCGVALLFSKLPKNKVQEKVLPFNKFPENLRAAIKEAGISQSDLAVKAGCAAPDITRYLKDRMPAADTLVRIARALGTTAEALLGLEPIPNVRPLEEVVKLPMGERTGREHGLVSSKRGLTQEVLDQRSKKATARLQRAKDAFIKADAELAAATAELAAVNAEFGVFHRVRLSKIAAEYNLPPEVRKAIGLD